MERYRNTWTGVGVLLVLVGWGPLLAIGLLAMLGLWPDPNPNPVGPGLLFFVTFWPAVICLGIGIAKGSRQPSLATESRVGSGPVHTSRPALTAEESAYVSSASFAGASGFFYFAYMGVPGAFFRHLLANIAWTRMVANARRWAWEAGDWPDFETFRRRDQRAETATKVVLALLVPLLLVVLVGK